MQKAAATHSAEIQQVKEELYRMMSENRDKIGNQKGLIKHLSSHVEPKPEDPVWYDLEPGIVLYACYSLGLQGL